MFNTLKYANMLEEAGFSREQAEMSIKILVEIMEDKLATKQDFADLKSTTSAMALATKQDFVELKSTIAADFVELKSTIAADFAVASMTTKQDLLQLKHDLTIKMAVMLSGFVTLTVTLVTAIHKFT